MIRTILGYCDRIQNGRTEEDILEHLDEERRELGVEIQREVYEHPPGEDGILGEAIDVLLCAIDYEHKKNPHITAYHIEAIILRKLDKWERLYG